MLIINLLGKVKIFNNGKDYTPILSNKTQALAFILIMQKGKYVTRDRLMYYLWPNSNEGAAQSNLRYNLWLLKKTIPNDKKGEPFIITDKDGITLNERYHFFCDWIEINNFNCNQESVDKLLKVNTLFTGDILEGWYLKHCTEFNEMILIKRMQCEAKHLELLTKLAETYLKMNQIGNAINIYEEIQKIEPNDEDIALKMMKLYLETGNRVAAINHYKNFETILWNDLSITPNEELRKHYLSLINNDINKKGIEPEKEHEKNLNKCTKSKANLKKLSIQCYCMADIDYFLVSEIIEQILQQVNSMCLLDFNYGYACDLGYIQRKIIDTYNKLFIDLDKDTRLNHIETAPRVRIVQAVIQFMKFIADIYIIEISIENINNIDNISAEIIRYFQNHPIKNLSFIDVPE